MLCLARMGVAVAVDRASLIQEKFLITREKTELYLLQSITRAGRKFIS